MPGITVHFGLVENVDNVQWKCLSDFIVWQQFPKKSNDWTFSRTSINLWMSLVEWNSMLWYYGLNDGFIKGYQNKRFVVKPTIEWMFSAELRTMPLFLSVSVTLAFSGSVSLWSHLDKNRSRKQRRLKRFWDLYLMSSIMLKPKSIM